MAQVRIAVIGAGLIGRTHIAVLRAGNPDYTLAGVADPSPAAAAEGKTLGYPVYATIDEMFERAKPDGAIVAVPNQLHVKVGLACIARKIPIIVEKPIADSVAEALELVEAGERANVPILTGHHRRHNPIMRKAARVIADGGIGRVVAANGLWLSHKPKDYFNVTWRREAGGGPILINAIHDIDCLRMLCGDIESVSAGASRATRNFEVEDTAAAVLHFKSGALGTLLVSDTVSAPWSWEWGSRENPNRPHDIENCYIVAGTRGSITVPSLQHRWHEAGTGELGQSADPGAAQGDAGRRLSRADAQLRRRDPRHRGAGVERARRHDHARDHARDHALGARPARRCASTT